MDGYLLLRAYITEKTECRGERSNRAEWEILGKVTGIGDELFKTMGRGGLKGKLTKEERREEFNISGGRP